jgi:hypothetical protein
MTALVSGGPKRYGTASGSERDQGTSCPIVLRSIRDTLNPNDVEFLSRSLPLAVL